MASYYTASEIATTSIRRWIVDGTLGPGQRLNQDEIAASLGLSRLPIREALRRLESDGLVTIVPRRGAMVAAMSADDIVDIYSVKISLEGTATRLGVPNLEDSSIKRMQELLHLMDQAQNSSNWAAWLDLDKEFHFILYRACGLPRLLGLVVNFWDLAERYRRLSLALPNRPQRSADAHQIIFAACQRRDAEAAEQAMMNALAEGRSILVAHAVEVSSLRSQMARLHTNGQSLGWSTLPGEG